MTKRYKKAVVIGRFQIPHNGHLELFQIAAKLADNVTIVIGSAHQPRTPKNPFTFQERKAMIIPMLDKLYIGPSALKKNYDFVAAQDYKYSDQHWLDKVIGNVQGSLNDDDLILVGHKKDASSYYLDMFPWHDEMVTNTTELNSTDLREKYLFSGGFISHELEKFTSQSTRDYIQEWADSNTERHYSLIEEYKFEQTYDPSSYPRLEQTADAVVVQNGHVLMIKRGNMPGKGLWALPGGFVGVNETVLEASYRELEEETCIDVPRRTLEYAVKDKEGKRFDHPERDPRGRLITHAFLYELPPHHKLTKVKGADDAADAKWFRFSEIEHMRAATYADHAEIIFRMTAGL